MTRTPRRLLEREFLWAVRPEEAWRRLTLVESWPEWARHIARAELSPPGPLGPASTGVFVLKPGIRSAFRVTEFVEGRSWKWRGPFLGLTVNYDHVLEPAEGGGTRVRFTVDAAGFGVAVLGPIFARVYGRNLDRAIARLTA